MASYVKEIILLLSTVTLLLLISSSWCAIIFWLLANRSHIVTSEVENQEYKYINVPPQIPSLPVTPPCSQNVPPTAPVKILPIKVPITEEINLLIQDKLKFEKERIEVDNIKLNLEKNKLVNQISEDQQVCPKCRNTDSCTCKYNVFQMGLPKMNQPNSMYYNQPIEKPYTDSNCSNNYVLSRTNTLPYEFTPRSVLNS